jgi:hypothetical protein
VAVQDDGVTVVNVQGGPEDGPYACPCCAYITLSRRGYYEICPVCFWEDEGQDDHDSDEVRGGPNRGLSLTEARSNFRRLGVADERDSRHVREPLPNEYPPV